MTYENWLRASESSPNRPLRLLANCADTGYGLQRYVLNLQRGKFVRNQRYKSPYLVLPTASAPAESKGPLAVN